jgi:hypothetical protein
MADPEERSMKAQWIICLAVSLAGSSTALAGSKKDIAKEIGVTTKAVKEACGCTVKFTYSRQLDFTAEHGSDLAFNVEKSIENTGEAAERWCKESEDHAAKFCLMVKTVETDEDTKTENSYSLAIAKGVIRSFIAGKNPKQRSYHGGIWVEPFLQTGKMRERKEED